MFPFHNLTIVESVEGKKAFLASLSHAKSTIVVSFLNAHAVTLSTKEPDFRSNLLSSDYLLRDGVGVSVLLHVLGIRSGLNMNGTDLMPEIVKAFSGRKVALCGTSEPWLSRACERVRAMGADVVLCMDGFQDASAYVEAIEQKKPELIVLAMGMPKQEAVAAILAKAPISPAVIVNSGAVLDFLSERFPRAPLVWRRLRLEWLFRLVHEPQRLWKRYILGGFEYLFIVLKWIFWEKDDAGDGTGTK